jgi:sugar/nucleoside kinase (ribokinase family)
VALQDRPSIVALGDLALDVFVAEQGVVVAGSDARGVVRVRPGGSAANVAVWCARLGAFSSFIGGVGDDYAGKFLCDDLEREGVVAHVVRCPAATAAIAVLLDDRGERSMITDRGAALQLHPDFISTSMFPPGSRLHLPAYSLFERPLADAALLAANLCRREGGRVGLDTSSVGPLRAYGRDSFLALLQQLSPDLLFANDAEAAFLSGTDDVVAGSGILRRYAHTVIWKLGARGAAARCDEFVRSAGLDVPVVDTTGAGDAFAAAFTVAIARGLSLAEALGLANRLAATVVQQVGARPAVTDGASMALHSMGLRGPSAGSSTQA